MITLNSESVSVQEHLCERIPTGQNRVRSAMATTYLMPWLLSFEANTLLADYISLWVCPKRNLTSVSADLNNETHSSHLIVNHSSFPYSVLPQLSLDPVSFTKSPSSLLIWIEYLLLKVQSISLLTHTDALVLSCFGQWWTPTLV